MSRCSRTAAQVRRQPERPSNGSSFALAPFLLRMLAVALPLMAACQPAERAGGRPGDRPDARPDASPRSGASSGPAESGRSSLASDSGGGAEARVRVTPIRAKRKTLVRFCEQPGRVAAFEQAPILAKVSGYVRNVHVDIGDVVSGPKAAGLPSPNANAASAMDAQPGQLLVELDVPELRDELAQKEAAVELEAAIVKRDEAAIRVAQAARDTATAREAEARAAQSRVVAEQERWRAEYDRISMLAARMAISDKVLDETRSKLAAAQAAFDESEARIRSAAAAAAEAEAAVAKAEADRDAAAARFKAAGAERDRARTMVGYAELRAPFDGVVSARNIDVGHLVGAGTGASAGGNSSGGSSAGSSGQAGAGGGKVPLLEIVAIDPVRIVVDVPESDAVMVEAGAAASVRLAALGADPFEGQVTRTTWSLNQATRTLRVEIDVPNANRRLRPGMFAHAKIKVAERTEALVLPKSAILAGPGKPACWVIGADGVLGRRELQLGLEAAGEVEVAGGLEPDDDVVGQNVTAFREGQVVDRIAAKL